MEFCIIGGALLLALYYLANVSQSSSEYGYGYQQYSRGFRNEGGSDNQIMIKLFLRNLTQ